MVSTKYIIQKIRNWDFAYKIFLRILIFIKPQIYKELEYFCLFVGYPRSGHTIIGALLDAHPEIVISMEADVLGLMTKKYSKEMILRYILRKSKKFISKLDGEWTKYSYKVPGQFQGTYKKIKIIGDKKGAKTTNRLIGNIHLLQEFEDFIGKPLKIIHIVRNPFDNIATIMIRDKEKGKDCNEYFFKSRIEYYFANVEMNFKIINLMPQKIISVYHEDFISDPKKVLGLIINFLQISASEDYFEKCCSIVNAYPNQTRYLINWPTNLIKLTTDKIAEYPFLMRYNDKEFFPSQENL